jgi:hypothetical protein
MAWSNDRLKGYVVKGFLLNVPRRFVQVGWVDVYIDMSCLILEPGIEPIA